MVADAMSAAVDYAIETRGLTRRFGSFTAVDNVALKIPKGELYGFLGLNGAGKTTTIRVLTTLLPPSAGDAKLWGHDVVNEPLAVRKLVGLVSDETSESQSTWTAREYLGYFAQEIRSLCSAISVIARGKIVYTGATRDLGADLDAFEDRLIDLLTHQG
jgi:ABC-type molybdenum transport system ATPase subunit/photorepair protein PhrA